MKGITKNWRIETILEIVNSYKTDSEAARKGLKTTPETLSRYLNENSDKIERIRSYRLKAER